jgi:hypothetical protein
MFNLGNFGGQLSIGDLNGALKATGSTDMLPEPPQTQLQMPMGNGGPSVGAEPVAQAAPEPMAQATDDERPGSKPMGGITDAPLKGIVNLQTIGTLVGSYFGGPAGGQIGGAIGGMGEANKNKQKQMGVLG